MKQKLNLSLDEEIAVKLKELAKKDHKTVSQWVTDTVMCEMKAEKNNKDVKEN